MDKLKNMWLRQDAVNRIILISGVALALVCLFMGHGLYGVVMIAVMGAFMVARTGGRVKRLSRLYGSLFFHAPDGEIVPMTFEQVRAEYLKGVGMRYMGRKVTIRYPYWRRNVEGELETGFGLCVDLSDFEDTEGLLPTLKKDQFISVTGELVPQGRDYFYLGKVQEVRRISEKEIYMA